MNTGVKLGLGRTLLFVVLLNIAGCSSYREAVISCNPSDRENREDQSVVQVGSTVRVVLRDGEVIFGRVIRNSSEMLVIKKRGESSIGYSDREIPVSDIESVGIEYYPAGSKVANVGLGVLVVWLAWTFSHFRVATDQN